MTDKMILLKERLYLDKARINILDDGKTDIYIDSCHVPTHHIEGIRYLYRQFTKNKPGVILNCQAGFGKSLQIALFLEAIRKLIKKRVLILCEDDKTIFKWKKTIGKRTKFTEGEIVIDASDVYQKKVIFLTKFMNLTASYTIRDWDIVVVNSDSLPIQLAKIPPLKTIFKIWSTSVDVRKDVETFNCIYCWLYWDKTFNVNSYIGSLCDEGQPLIRAKLMNEFMEDIVYVNKKLQSNISESIQENTPKEKVSRKNKDATGTKIKRSKITKESDVSEGTNVDANNTHIEINVGSNSKPDLKINQKMDHETNTSVRDERLMESEQYPTDAEFTALNDLENENDVNDIHSESVLDEMMLPSDEQYKNLNVSTGAVSSPVTSSNADKCTDTKTVDNIKKLIKKDVFQAISEMEEAMKKFKGSILDKLF